MSDATMSHDSSDDDEIPVARLARYKMEKKESALPNPNEDGSSSRSEDGSSSRSEDSNVGSDSDSEDSDYGKEDAIAQRKYLNRQRLERGRARAAIQAPLLSPIHPKTRTKKYRPTNEEITLWENAATQRMMEKTNSDDLLAAHMLLVHVKLSPWESEMSMFFLVGHVLEVDPFHFILGKSTEANLLPRAMLENNQWNVPKLPNMPINVETFCKIAHKIIAIEWKKTKDRVEEQHSHALKDVTVAVNLPTVQVPPCPEFSSLKTSVNKGRANMWKIWWGHPECCDRDVREEVVQWAASNLIPLNILNDFRAVIDAYADDGINQHRISYYKSIGQSILPDFFGKKKPIKKPKKKRKKPPKKKQKQTTLDVVMGGKSTDNPTDEKPKKKSDSTDDKNKKDLANDKKSNKKKSLLLEDKKESELREWNT